VSEKIKLLKANRRPPPNLMEAKDAELRKKLPIYGHLSDMIEGPSIPHSYV